MHHIRVQHQNINKKYKNTPHTGLPVNFSFAKGGTLEFEGHVVPNEYNSSWQNLDIVLEYHNSPLVFWLQA